MTAGWDQGPGGVVDQHGFGAGGGADADGRRLLPGPAAGQNLRDLGAGRGSFSCAVQVFFRADQDDRIDCLVRLEPAQADLEQGLAPYFEKLLGLSAVEPGTGTAGQDDRGCAHFEIIIHQDLETKFDVLKFEVQKWN